MHLAVKACKDFNKVSECSEDAERIWPANIDNIATDQRGICVSAEKELHDVDQYAVSNQGQTHT